MTNGVGALSAINDVGGSYRDHVPVICIVGSISLRSIDRGLAMHHTTADGTFDRFLDASAHVTAAHPTLKPPTAAIEIDRPELASLRDCDSWCNTFIRLGETACAQGRTLHAALHFRCAEFFMVPSDSRKEPLRKRFAAT